MNLRELSCFYFFSIFFFFILPLRVRERCCVRNDEMGYFIFIEEREGKVYVVKYGPLDEEEGERNGRCGWIWLLVLKAF